MILERLMWSVLKIIWNLFFLTFTFCCVQIEFKTKKKINICEYKT